ncbi:hypothetical protein JRQ81_009345 [Phrynocephalus forsythii]|uniref:MH1 domain-containing protein n=1 Tax=Phrynocephalus forsythii TaxID=171643 RepID=A0A9Q0XBM7_9SAUR|nr:hypothetical protein JRQ81_009345 [Phrynocephalus forsythii]
MFRPRRATLVQRLWRRRCVTPGPEDGHAPLKLAAHAFFKKLRDPELEALLQAVEGKGAGESACVWVEARGFKPGLPPVLLLCRLYRWPDLGHPHELKRLSFCRSAGGEASTHCCNPHHLSRLAVPETPPPAYGKTSPFALPLKSSTAFGRNRNAWQDTTLSRHSLKDGYWCKLAYWEYRLRVGRLYPVHDDSVRVSSATPPLAAASAWLSWGHGAAARPSGGPGPRSAGGCSSAGRGPGCGSTTVATTLASSPPRPSGLPSIRSLLATPSKCTTSSGPATRQRPDGRARTRGHTMPMQCGSVLGKVGGPAIPGGISPLVPAGWRSC